MSAKNMTFNEAQRDVLGVISCLHKEDDVNALKKILLQFLNDRLQDELDGLWEQDVVNELSTIRRWRNGKTHTSERHINNDGTSYCP